MAMNDLKLYRLEILKVLDLALGDSISSRETEILSNICDVLDVLCDLRKCIISKNDYKVIKTMNKCLKLISISDDFWMRYKLMELLSWYVIIFFDNESSLNIDNMQLISHIMEKWNFIINENIKNNKRNNISFEEGISEEEITSNDEDDLEEVHNDEEESEDNNGEEEENEIEEDITNNILEELEDNNDKDNKLEEALEEEDELEENDDEDDEMEFEESDDEEFEDPSSIHRITEGVNNHWSFNFQEDHSSLKI
ncbi:hypothetical protein ENUP19_0293G0002 [Entamoeba nuttalli]|uniref:Uncharacterized protein n=1 Tax=Entamoeba nuttalli TaxID=412467 RepID=A0ABQ0DUI0_9EUKA